MGGEPERTLFEIKALARARRAVRHGEGSVGEHTNDATAFGLEQLGLGGEISARLANMMIQAETECLELSARNESRDRLWNETSESLIETGDLGRFEAQALVEVNAAK